jgi:5-methylcytosine-specific restriction endonuclease McrBC regulatory subunit McrC
MSDVDKSKLIFSRIGRQDKALIEDLNKRFKFEIKLEDGKLRVKASQFIGSADFQNAKFKLAVVPKIFQHDPDKRKRTAAVIDFARGVKVKNIIESQRNYYDNGVEPLLEDILHNQLVAEAENLLRRGLLRSYVVHAENTPSLRGKLLFQHQMLNDATGVPKFFSEYDELEYDNTENRVILQALVAVGRTKRRSVMGSPAENDLSKRTRQKSIMLAEQFSEVVQKTWVEKQKRLRLMQGYTRQNHHYKNALQISTEVIERMGIPDIYRPSALRVKPFFVDFDKQVEGFVERLFKDYYPGRRGRPSGQKREKAWDTDEFKDKKMIPDIVIEDDGLVLKIIDVKHKPEITSSDLYQMGFYMHEYGKEYNQALQESFAILPEYTDHKNIKHEKVGTYKAARSEKKVHVKRIDIAKCVDMIRGRRWNELEDLVGDLVDLPGEERVRRHS